MFGVEFYVIVTRYCNCEGENDYYGGLDDENDESLTNMWDRMDFTFDLPKLYGEWISNI